MSEIEIKVDLDLDSKKAKEKLNDFKQLAEKEDIKIKLDLDNAKSEALQLKNVLSDAFKLDKSTLGNLKQVESSIKEINKLLKAQSNLSKPGSSKGLDLGINPISINKNVDIVKDINMLVGDYKKATEQLEDLDAVGKSMKAALDGFNEDQEQAFKKFSQDSKRYDTYLKDLEGDNLTSTLKKAIASRKKAIELQEQLTKSGVVKVNNDQIRNEKTDGSMFTIENEKWKAMFAKSESEAKDLEDMARKLKPQIDKANSTVEELVKKMSDDERKLLDTISKSYEQRPQFDKLSSGMDNDNVNILRMYLENLTDVDKMGLDFNNLDDVFRGLDRYYSRLEQMQREYNTKFAGEDGFKPMRMDSLMDIEQDQVKKIINEAEQNNNLLENIFKDRNRLGTINNENLSISGVNESEIRNMEEFVRLSRLMNQVSNQNKSSNNVASGVKEYLAVSKQIDDVISKLYKSENRNQGETTESLRKELSLLEEKRAKLEKLVDTNSDYIRQERELATAKALTSMSREDDSNAVKSLREEEQQIKSLIDTYDRYEKELTQLKTAQNELRYKGKDSEANALEGQINALEELKRTLKEVNNEQFGDRLYPDLERIENKYREVARAAEELSRGRFDDANNAKLDKTYQDLDKIQDKLTSMQNTKGFLDNDLLERTNNLLAQTRNQLDADGISSDFEKVNNSVNELTSNLRQLSDGNTLNRQEANFNVSLENMRNKLESFKNSIQDLRGSDDVVERLENSFRSIDTSNIERATVDLRQFGNELQQAQREMRQLETSGRSFFGNFGQEFRDNLFTFTAGELLADGIRNVAYSLKTIVMEYDTAMTNLKKVADPSDIMNIGQLDAIEQKAVSIAKNVGQSSQDVIQAISDTIQMGGYGMEQATQIAEQTMMLANVAELTQEVASKGVVTMMSAFNLDPMKEIPIVVNGVTKSTDELTNAMDKINYVGNNFAISSGGILDAITSGANVLANYGVSMTDTVAMITAANTTLQDTSRVGNGLKTIQTRLAGIKTSAKDGTLSLNKTAMALKEIADIDVFSDESKGELKGMSDIITELGEKWADLTDKQRAGLSEAIAGANQASVFQSLMTNFEVMKKVQEELGQGMQFGSMFAENEQYIDSIAGKLNTLKEVWVGVFNTIFSSDATKNILDGLISISEAIANVITMLDETGMLTPVLMGLGVMLASKAFTGLPNLFRGGTESARGFSSIIPRVAEGLGNFGLMGTRAGVALLGVEGAFASAGVATSGFLATAASFIPWAVAGAVAVGGLIWAFDHFNESLDEEKERLNESIATRKQEIASIEDQKSKLQGIQEEYDKLANKPKKTADEVERLAELTKQIAEIRPDLIVGYDDNNNPILSMTGDVQDLINEMDRATESKKKLLSVEQDDLAKNSIKQLHGSNGGRLESEGYRPDTEMNKLEDITSQHVTKMSNLEAKRDKLLNKLYSSTGKERQQILKDLEKANYDIEKQQSDFANSYQQQLQVVQEYSSKIGEGIFASLENSSVFKNMDSEMQSAFSNLKDSLDFTDIKTEDQLLEVEMAMNNLMKAFANGDVEIDKVSSAIEKANKEFAKTGDAEKYSESINKIISDLEKATGKDFSALKDVFEGMDTSVLKGKDALDEFLRAYNKTRADLDKDDGFAKALANQKRQIEQAIEELNSISGDAEIDLELAYNIINNNELPMELRDMVRVLINKGYNSTEVVQFAQEILVDISDGKIDIDVANEKIKEKFGEGAFEITPEILMSESTRIAGVETVLKQIEERFGEIPPVIKTIIEAEGVTAFNDAKAIMETYNSIPEEVRTVMSTNGTETLADIVNINNMLGILPNDVVMNILTNFPEVVQGAGSVEQIISSLPPSVLMEIQSNYPEVVEGSQMIKDAIDKIPATKESTVSVKEDIKKDSGGFLDRLFGKKDTSLTATAVINAQVNNIEALKETENIINRLTGGSFGGSSGGGAKRSVEQFDISPIDDVSPLARASKGSSGGGGGGHSISVDVNVSGQEELQRLQDLLDRFTVEDVKATISINTAQSAQNLSGLISRLNQTKAAIDGIGSKDVSINTALAAQNLSGLLVRVREYTGSDIATKTCSVETAQAAKNISGLIAKINQYNGVNPKTLNFKTNASTIASQVKSLASAVRSVPNGKTINYSIRTTGSVPKLSSPRMSVGMPSGQEIQAQTLGIQAQLRDGLSANPIDLSNTFTGTTPTVSPMLRGKVTPNNSMDYFKLDVNAFKDIETALEKINKQLDLLDKKAKLAFGNDKANLLKRQLSLLEKQQSLQNKMSDDLKVYQNELKYFLGQNGVNFDKSGNVINEQEKLLSIAKKIDELNKKSSNSKDDGAKKNYDSQKESLESVKKALEEYINISNGKIPGCTAEWYELQKQINDTKVAILEAKNELRDFRFDNNISNMETGLSRVQREISRLDKEIDRAFGDKKADLIKKKVALLKEEQKQLHNLANEYRKQATDIGKFLNDQGFIIDNSGKIGNYAEQLEKLKDSPVYEYIKKQLDEFISIINDKIPDAQDKWKDLQYAIEDCSSAIKEAQEEAKNFKIEIDIGKAELALRKIQREISRLDKQIDKAFGKNKENLLNKKIEALKKEQDKLHELANSYRKQAQAIGKYLNSLGFNINAHDGMIDLDFLEKLKDHKDFDFIVKQLEKYIELTQNKIPGLGDDWQDLQDDIEDAKDAIEEARKELEKFIEQAKVDTLLDQFNDLGHQIDLIDKKLQHATGTEKLDLISKKLELIKQQQIELQKHHEFFTNKKNELQGYLGGLGFTFDGDGDISNYVEQLERIANSSDNFEEVKEKLEEYFDIQNDRLPGIESDWLDLENAYKDVLKDQLNTTKQIEDKITAMYKKQVQDRIDQMNKETEAKKKALKEQQDAYNKYRDEVDYKNEYDDKLSEINRIQKQLDIAMRDTSLAGQKKVQELQKLLADAQKELDKHTQDKIDSDINDMFDKESDRIDEENDKLIEQLEEMWSDSKIAEMVAQALESGLFTGIDGVITNLEDALIKFAEDSGDLFGVMGSVIKSELITNLEIAKDTVKELGQIIKDLDLEKFSTMSNSFGFDVGANSIRSLSPVTNNTTSSVTFSSPIIQIDGNVDSGVIEDLEAYGNKIVKQVIDKISSSIR